MAPDLVSPWEQHTAGTYYFAIPHGVESLTIEAYGGGGGGGGGYYDSAHTGDPELEGGAGGNGAHAGPAVIPLGPSDWGKSLTVIVGAGGAGGAGGGAGDGDPRYGVAGEGSSVMIGSTLIVQANGGARGNRARPYVWLDGEDHPTYDPLQQYGAGGDGGKMGMVLCVVGGNGVKGDDGWVSIECTMIEYDLGLSVAGDGSGSASVYDGTDWTHLVGHEGTHTFTHGTVVKVVADPCPCSLFDGWSGDFPAGEWDQKTIFVTMDAHKSLAAHFDLWTCTVDVSATEGGSVYIDYPAMHAEQAVMVVGGPEFLVGPGDTEPVDILCCEPEFLLEAMPEDGWLFSHWEYSGAVMPSEGSLPRGTGGTMTLELTPGGESTHNPEVFEAMCEGEYGAILATFVEEPGGRASITVKVVKVGGGDVEGIPVAFGGELVATIHTDSSGVAKLSGLWPGDYTVNASAAGYTSDGPKDVEVEHETSEETVTITLSPVAPAPPLTGPGRIEGLARDAHTAAALPGVLVKLSDTTETILGMTMSGPAGEFAFDGLDPGDYEVEGTLAGYSPDSSAALVVHDATTLVVLELAPAIAMPPAPPAGEPVVSLLDLPKTGGGMAGMLVLSGLMLAAGAVARRRGF